MSSPLVLTSAFDNTDTIVIHQPGSIVNFAAEARMYAVQMQPNFVHYLAERTVIPDNAVLHTCTDNPLVTHT